jgi:hypothetical protein
MSKMSLAAKHRIVALYPTSTAKVLARQFGVSKWKIMRVVQEAGATKYRITDDDRRDITHAYANGESINALASRYGVNRSYITVIAKAGGACLRQPRNAAAFYLAYVDSGFLPYWGA